MKYIPIAHMQIHWSIELFQISRERSEDDSLVVITRNEREDCPIALKVASEKAFRGIFYWLNHPSNYDSEAKFLQDAYAYIYTLSVQSFIDWLHDPTVHNDTRGHIFHAEVNYLAFIADMLFYVPDSVITVEQHNTIISKLDSMVTYCDSLLLLTEYGSNEWGLQGSYSTLPKNCIIQQRPALLAGFGHCVLILMQDDEFMQVPGNEARMNASLDLINNDFLYTDYFGETGILDINTQKSGAWSEGIGYGAFTFSRMVIFFTSYKRITNDSVNYFNNPHVTGIMNHVIKMLSPELKELPYDDMWNMNIGKYLMHGVAEFFYQNTNNIVAKNMAGWYINCLKSGTIWPTEINFSGLPRYHIVVCYNPDRDIPVDSYFETPECFTNGSYSDEEFTILRDEVNDKDNLIENPAMYILHENSIGIYHDQGDQSSYLFYYKGKQLIIDPGYKPDHPNVPPGGTGWFYGLDWCKSSYAHNLIVVTPDSVSEYNELDLDFWNYNFCSSFSFSIWQPDGSTPYNNNPACPNPAVNQYLIKNSNIEKTKVFLEYNYPDNDVQVYRNYYKVEDIFVIFDDVHSNSFIDSTYWNSIHFANALSSEDITDNIFSIRKGSARLHGIVGCNITFTTYYNEFSPYLLPNANWGSNPTSSSRFHKRLRISTKGHDPKFLTILIPSESEDNPITEIQNGENYYGVVINNNLREEDDNSHSFYGVGDNSSGSYAIEFSEGNVVETTGSFFGFCRYDVIPPQFKEIMLSNGDTISYNDTTLFESKDLIEEMLAYYHDGELNVIIKSDDQFPTYTILRQGITPDNFTSIGVENGQNGDTNTQNIYYDDEYFYVNQYNFSEGPVYLENTIIVPENATLSIGSGVEIYGMNPDVKIEVYGNIEIGDSVKFTAPDTVIWDGLYLLNADAEVAMNNVTFERCKLHNESLFLNIRFSFKNYG